MELIHHKIGRIREYVSILNSIKDDCIKRFTSDSLYRGALLHYLYMLTDSCISLAEMVIKHKHLRLPQTYQEAIDILGDNKVLDSDFAYSFAKIADFRNFLAHDYEKVSASSICKDALAKVEEVEEFLRQLEVSLNIKSC